MLTYTSQKQLSLFDFRTPFGQALSVENRWVKLSKLLDWDKLVSVYAKSMSSDKGATSIDARIKNENKEKRKTNAVK